MIENIKILGTHHYPIHKFTQHGLHKVDDVVAVETPLLIKLKLPDNSIENLVITMHTPGHNEDLVRGFLYTEGIINNPDQIVSIQNGEAEMLVQLNQAPQHLAARNTVSTAACGMCGKTSLDAIKLVRDFNLQQYQYQIAPETILKFSDKVRAAQVLFESTGGIHAAALFDCSGELISLREDIGRHNAVDKTIGSMLQNELSAHEVILFVSGRAGFELVQKSIVSGITMMIAVGAPSSLAVDYATKYGMTLIGFMQATRFNIYSHSERLILEKN